MKMKMLTFLCKIDTDWKFWSFLTFISKDIREFERMKEIFTVLKNQCFVEKKRGFASNRVNMVEIWSLSLDSLKKLKRYIDIFKKHLSYKRILQNDLTKSKNDLTRDHIIRASPVQIFSKINAPKNFVKIHRKYLCRSLIYNKVPSWKISQTHKKTSVLESGVTISISKFRYTSIFVIALLINIYGFVAFTQCAKP